MFERFTNQSRRVVVLSQEEARMLDHNYIGTEHLLLGLVHEGRGSAARALAAMDVTLDAARDQVVAIIGRGQVQPSGHIPFTPRAKKSLELSLREALQLGHAYIATGHLLLGLIHHGDNVAIQILGNLGTDLSELHTRVIQELRDHPEEGQELLSDDREGQQLKSFLRTEVQGLLDAIENRLTAIEGRLGITQSVSVAVRTLEERIAQVRRDKEAAIDVQDFARAAALRDTEKGLLQERVRVEQEAAAGAGLEAGAGPGVGAVAGAVAGAAAGAAAGAVAGARAGAEGGSGAGVGSGLEGDGELGRLRDRVADLEARLRENGIDPGEPREASEPREAGEPPAAAG